MKGARVGVLTAIAGLGLLGLTACGSDSSGSPAPKQQQQELPAAAGPRANLVAQEVGALGQGMTDQQGMTLYMFTKDSNKPPVSNCYDACEKSWPPMIAEGKELTFTGIDQKLIGTITRKDGKKQVTINDWPVYTFAKDTAPGESKGNGMGGTWYVITPEGKKLQAQTNAPASQPPQSPKEPAAPPASANTNSGGDGGYDSGNGY